MARAFSDPPINLLAGRILATGLQLAADTPPAVMLPVMVKSSADASERVTVGIRAGALRVQARSGDVALTGQVELAEISGSDTFVHIAAAVGPLVAQLTGVHEFELGAAITLYVDPAQVYVFDARGTLLIAPALPGAR